MHNSSQVGGGRGGPAGAKEKRYERFSISEITEDVLF
jgi:hypothetical protein